MSMSSGGRNAVMGLVGWAIVLATAVAAIIYFPQVSAGVRQAAGLSSHPAQAVARPSPSDRSQPTRSGRRVELVAERNGHFVAEVEINGRSIDAMIDTGASIIALTDDDARRAGIFVNDGDYTHRVSTANGTARVAMVMLDRVSVGAIEVRNVQAAVSEPGALNATLLGMSFLSRVKTMTSNGRMVIEE